ncbi:CHRD domain-containing protein [Haladaptatus litoreus]|uniref:CHRD domain-containing protein n=1 Tax=Haladaptatus litoreus TaxID=553468 RepID=A0A1N7D9X5_9EURY|nr:CHRD domain-containing protein [Haladaptatus litoreus]SIR72639.1 CHRD domain-containing protein [Haladaptatus litoreus]
MVSNSRRDVLKVVGTGTVASVGLGTQSAGADTKDCADEKQTVFSAGKLSGAQEVPPVETKGEGAAVFKFADHGDGPHIHYALLVANTENVTQAHIHLGQKGENGDVVTFLFGLKNDEGEFVGALDQGVTENGVLATGSITAADLVGPLAGKSLSVLVEAMRAGNTYVNVHTEQNPPGEIRGQIRAVNAVEVELEEEVEVAAKKKLDVEELVQLQIDED